MSIHVFGESGVVLGDDETLGATPPTVESILPYVLLSGAASGAYHYRAAVGSTASEITFNCPTYTKIFFSCRIRRTTRDALLSIHPVSGATQGEGFGIDTTTTGSYALLTAAGAVSAVGAGDPSAFPAEVGDWDKLSFVLDTVANTIVVTVNGRASTLLSGAAATLTDVTGVIVSMSDETDMDEVFIVDLDSAAPNLNGVATRSLRVNADDPTRAHWWAATTTRSAQLIVTPPELAKYTRMAGLGEQGYVLDDPTGTIDPGLVIIKARTRAFGAWTTNPVLSLGYDDGTAFQFSDITLVADGVWTWESVSTTTGPAAAAWTIATLTNILLSTTTKDQ